MERTVVTAPMPSQYTKNSTVEELASEWNLVYREKRSNAKGYPIDIEAFVDLSLEHTIEEAEIEEPPFTVVFAKCRPDEEDVSHYVITLNTRYRELFKLRPDILRSCIGHELGHIILGHHKWKVRSSNMDSLFPDMEVKPRYLHDSSWNPHGLMRQEMDEWCRQAFKGNEEARQMLRQLQDCMEPEWMFWQAEHFSMCFLIPHDQLFRFLNEGYEVNTWRGIYQLAESFGVSPSMMKVRLVKIGAIIMRNGKPTLGEMFRQMGLYK